MNRQPVITLAPVATSIGSGLIALSFYAKPTWSPALNLLGVIVCSMSLGALLVSYPRSA